jgi:hypothetical protein
MVKGEETNVTSMQAIKNKKEEDSNIESIHIEYNKKTKKMTTKINASNDICLSSIIELTMDLSIRTGLDPDLILVQISRDIAIIEDNTPE